MKITLVRRSGFRNCSDEWQATAERLIRSGVGRNRDEALGSLMRANPEAFGVDEIEDRDPDPENRSPIVTWKSRVGIK